VSEQTDVQAEAANAAARARQAIAMRIAALLPQVDDDAKAQIVLQLAQAYAHLAAEPPRVRAT